ncbi:MAG: inositol monophosphatase family protein, partial [Gammaproteobacteria bacterium]
AAGAVIAAHRGRAVAVEHKAVGTSIASQVVTEVDRLAQVAILEVLDATRTEFGLALLTEESPDDGSRHERPAFWSIDPMDGTLAFTRDEPGFAVSIALVSQAGEPLLGVVLDPVTDTLWRAVRGAGATRNGRALRVGTLDPDRPLTLRTDVSFGHHPWLEATREGLEALARTLGLPGAELRFRGGAVLNACNTIADANALYFKYARKAEAGGSLWDYAATACIVTEAGGVATDITGAPMELNRAGSTFMNHRGVLYTADERVARGVIALEKLLRESGGASPGPA